jgi:hypothetical protein
VGKTKQGEYIVLDKDSFFYETNAGSLKPIGPFETMMGLDATHAPVEFSETKVYGKSIPTGIVLAYLYGLDKLLQMLKVNPRRVNAGQRLNLQDHEYAIVFSDETLIFSKEDLWLVCCWQVSVNTRKLPKTTVSTLSTRKVFT